MLKNKVTQEKIRAYFQNNVDILEQSTDPSAKKIPFSGKLVWTYNLVGITLFLLCASIIVGQGVVSLKENPWYGPKAEVLLRMGGNQGLKLQSGEWWRLIWAGFLHAGWFHWSLNMINWVFLSALIEPDWGFTRTCITFIVAMITGNALSASCDPVVISVGISSGIFGLLGASIPYVTEYWTTIPQPKFVILIFIISLITGIVTGIVPQIDTYAHIGGTIGGFLFGFFTITKLDFLTVNDTEQSKNQTKIQKLKQLETQPELDTTKSLTSRTDKSSCWKIFTKKICKRPSFPILKTHRKSKDTHLKLSDKTKQLSEKTPDFIKTCCLLNSPSTSYSSEVHSTSNTMTNKPSKSYETKFSSFHYDMSQNLILPNELIPDNQNQFLQNYHIPSDQSTNEPNPKIIFKNKISTNKPMYNIDFKKIKIINRPKRITIRHTKKNFVDDSFDWKNRTAWIVRVTSGFLLGMFWLILYLLIKYESSQFLFSHLKNFNNTSDFNAFQELKSNSFQSLRAFR